MKGINLRVVRSGQPPELHPRAEYRVVLPTVELRGSLEESLTAVMERVPGVASVDATSIVEASRWERFCIEWMGARAGVPVRWAPEAPAWGHSVSRALQSRDIAGWSEVPEGVTVRRAATRRGEARATVGSIRAWLAENGLTGEAAARALDDVAILVPGRPEVFAIWHRELDFADIPTRSQHLESVAVQSVARWVVALAQLKRWATSPVPREHLRSVLEPRFWSQRAVVGPGSNVRLRRELRGLLTSIRRDSFRYGDWMAHVRRSCTDATCDTVLGFSQKLLDAVSEGPHFYRRLGELLNAVELRACLRATENQTAIVAAEKVTHVVWQLAYEEEHAGGEHPEAVTGVDALLERRLRSTWLARTERRRHGVDLIAYEGYDGRETALLFATGLGEGDFPVVPRRWDAEEESFAREVGLLEPDESVDDYFHDELERQIRQACRASEACRGDVTLSYSTEGPGTEERYPGALLSLLVGGWSEADWYGGRERVDVHTWADEIPNSLADAQCWGDVALFAENPQFRRWLREVDHPCFGPEDHEARRQLQDSTRLLTSSQEAFRDRHPRPDEVVRFGNYSGMLPGPVQRADAYSASALEAYGQCGTKYFFGKMLRVSDRLDLSEALEPTETGTIIHNAFADAAHEIVDLAKRELWSMCIEPGESKDEAVERIQAVVDRHLVRNVRAFLEEEASMSEHLVEAVVARWSGALRQWVESHVVERLPGVPSDEELGTDTDVAKARVMLQSYDDSIAHVLDLKAAVEAGDVTSMSAAKSFRSTGGNKVLTGSKVAELFKEGNYDAFVDELREARPAAEAALEEAEAAARLVWASHFNRDVVHAELAFGMERSDSDPHSLAEPVTVHVEELSIPVRGQVDRVDWDTDRGQLAVRDFKTGRSKGAAKLGREIAAGIHLQLPLYAMAIEELARLGKLPHLRGAETVEVSLEFPRHPPMRKRYATELRLDQPSGYLLGDEPVRWGTLAREWLGSHVRNIESGHFPLFPSACPVENTGYCDFQRCCGYTAEFGRRAEEPRPRRPLVEPVDGEGRKVKYPCEAVSIPVCLGGEVDSGEVREAHEAAGLAAADVGRDVAIAAGAGTGKTYNLVLRYLAALADGVAPSEILCITFTRRAAAEMKSRIREALLSEPAGPQKEFVERLRADPESFRRLLLALSAAPITTIDSLAGRVFGEAEAYRARRAGTERPAPEVVTDNDVADQLRTFVRQSFLDGIEGEDPHLRHLSERLDPIKVRELLQEACRREISDRITSLATLEERRDALLAGWDQVMAPAARDVLQRMRSWPLDQFEELLEGALAETAKSKQPSDEGAEWMKAFIARMRDPKPFADGEAWRWISDVYNGSISQGRFGKTGLSSLFREHFTALKDGLDQHDPSRGAAVKAWAKELDALPEYAGTAAHATFVAQRWSEAFRDYLVSLGRVRFSDVEVLARRALADPEIAAALAGRFAYRQVFVDEAQDTSDSQIRLIQAVARVASLATGEPCREFVVGDVKQSIYAFRGAEVDVFTRRMAEGAERFTINRRSTPSLIRAFNTLFEALFGAEGTGGASLDPRAGVPFEPLAWPEDRADTEEAAIEFLVAPGQSWFPAEADEDDVPPEDADEEEEEESSEETFRATLLQRGLARRIGELVEAYPPGDQGASVAILVGSWRRADFYRDLLSAYDIPAAVQGGRGLLNSPEVDGLVQWLEAIAFPNRHISFLGCLRGPGIALSDAGLYCLRAGHGVTGLEGEPPFSLKGAAVYGAWDAQEALRAWFAAAPDLDTDRTAYLLQSDHQSLQKFKAVWAALPSRLGVEAPSETIAWLADTLGLWTFWHSQPKGRQAVANIRTFLDLVRDLEASLGQDPWLLLRRLDEMRDNSDPAAGGLDASGGAPVVITTYWQAKGLEWPVVVLPDLDKTKVRGQTRGLGDNRICIVDDDLAVVHTPEVRVSRPERPMDSQTTAVTDALDQYRRPAQRSEIRRLLYVAMTRAREKLVMSATVDVPTSDDPDDPKATTLCDARDWGTTMRICLDLRYDDEQREVRTGQRSLWAGLESTGRVRVYDGEAYGDGEVQTPGARRRVAVPEDVDVVRNWLVVPSDRLELLRPSDMVVAELPTADAELSTELPEHQEVRDTPFANEADEGTAFHALMEALAFGGGDLVEMAQRVLAAERLDLPVEARTERVEAIVTMARRAMTAPIVAELRAAAERGELYHELPLQYARGDRWVFGVVDLVWRDEEGRFHILDYKTGYRYPTRGNPQSEQARHHYAQTEIYAEGLEACGLEVGSFGLWYVAAPALLRWRR